MRRQLYGEDDDRSFFDSIRQELKATDKKLEEGRAVLHHLEMYLVNVACNAGIQDEGHQQLLHVPLRNV